MEIPFVHEQDITSMLDILQWVDSTQMSFCIQLHEDTMRMLKRHPPSLSFYQEDQTFYDSMVHKMFDSLPRLQPTMSRQYRRSFQMTTPTINRELVLTRKRDHSDYWRVADRSKVFKDNVCIQNDVPRLISLITERNGKTGLLEMMTFPLSTAYIKDIGRGLVRCIVRKTMMNVVISDIQIDDIEIHNWMLFGLLISTIGETRTQQIIVNVTEDNNTKMKPHPFRQYDKNDPESSFFQTLLWHNLYMVGRCFGRYGTQQMHTFKTYFHHIYAHTDMTQFFINCEWDDNKELDEPDSRKLLSEHYQQMFIDNVIHKSFNPMDLETKKTRFHNKQDDDFFDEEPYSNIIGTEESHDVMYFSDGDEDTTLKHVFEYNTDSD